jgi:hypothetical protein
MRRLSPAAALIALVLAAGCGGGSGELTKVRKIVDDASRATKAKGSAHFVASRQTSPSATPVSANGAIDFKSDEQAFTYEGGGIKAEVRLAGDKQYAKLSGDIIPEPQRDVWISRPETPNFRQQHTGLIGISMLYLQLAQGFVSAGDGVADKIGDVAVRKYVIEVEPTLNLYDYRLSTQTLQKEQTDELKEETSGRFNVWIDKDKLIRKFQLVVDKPKKKKLAISVDPAIFTVEMSDFGAPAGVEAPPESEVRDESSFRPTPAPSAAPNK